MMREIPLNQGYVAIVDDEDYDRLAAFRWRVQVRRYSTRTCLYAIRTTPKADGERGIYMHRDVLGCAEPVDHIDADGLNNRRGNLRAATPSQNNGNLRKGRGSSKFKGVCWNIAREQWKAYVCYQRRNRHLGYFRDEADAAQAYNFAALETFGEFARLNQAGIP